MLQDSSKSTDSEEDASDAISLVTDDGNFHQKFTDTYEVLWEGDDEGESGNGPVEYQAAKQLDFVDGQTGHVDFDDDDVEGYQALVDRTPVEGEGEVEGNSDKGTLGGEDSILDRSDALEFLKNPFMPLLL